jgi:hypothetical protein
MYEEIVDSIYNLIHNSSFSIPIVPKEFYGTLGPDDEFLAVQILMPNSELFFNAKKINGLLCIDIFTKVGEGDLKSASLLDELDSVFQGTALSNGLHFLNSQSIDHGKDRDNPSLRRVEYQIPFKLYGEL